MHLLRFAISDLQSVIEANRHAYIQCSSTASLPSVECGTMPQQRYRLVGQRSITCFAIVSRPSPPSDASATVKPQSRGLRYRAMEMGLWPEAGWHRERFRPCDRDEGCFSGSFSVWRDEEPGNVVSAPFLSRIGGVGVAPRSTKRPFPSLFLFTATTRSRTPNEPANTSGAVPTGVSPCCPTR
mgnify:CR=1 FL=1